MSFPLSVVENFLQQVLIAKQIGNSLPLIETSTKVFHKSLATTQRRHFGSFEEADGSGREGIGFATAVAWCRGCGKRVENDSSCGFLEADCRKNKLTLVTKFRLSLRTDEAKSFLGGGKNSPRSSVGYLRICVCFEYRKIVNSFTV